VEVAERFSLSEKAAGADPDPQSSNSSGSDGSNTKSGTGSASVGSKAGVWSRRKSPGGGPRAGEIGGGVCGSSRCWRHGVWRSGQDAVVPMAMDAQGRYEASDPLQTLSPDGVCRFYFRYN
jgi:hypothetical protein